MKKSKISTHHSLSSKFSSRFSIHRNSHYSHNNHSSHNTVPNFPVLNGNSNSNKKENNKSSIERSTLINSFLNEKLELPNTPEKEFEASHSKKFFYNDLLNWSQDGKLLVGMDDTCYIPSLTSGGIETAFTTDNSLTSCNFLTNEVLAVSDERSLRVIDLVKSSEIIEVEGSVNRIEVSDTLFITTSTPSSFFSSPNNSSTHTNDNNIKEGERSMMRFYDPREKKEVGQLQTEGLVSDVKMNIGRNCVASASGKNIDIFDMRNLNSSMNRIQKSGEVSALFWNPFNPWRLLCGTADGKNSRLSNNCIKEKKSEEKYLNKSVGGIAFNYFNRHRGSEVIVAAVGNEIQVRGLKNMNRLGDIKKAHEEPINFLKVNPADSNVYASWSVDEKLKVWKLFDDGKKFDNSNTFNNSGMTFR